MCFCNSDGSADGSQRGHWMRLLARSKMMSEACENLAGAGVDPNGSLVRIVAMLSCLSELLLLWFVFHVEMHFDDMVAVVCKCWYAFSMSPLLSNICLFG